MKFLINKYVWLRIIVLFTLFSCKDDAILRDLDSSASRLDTAEMADTFLSAPFISLGNAPQIARHGMTPSKYQTYFNSYTSQGFRLVQVDGYNVKGQVYFAAIWEKSSGPAYIARHGMSSSQYQNYFSSYTSKGYRLVWIDGYEQNGEAYYAAIWEKSSGSAYVARHGMSSSQYQNYFNMYTSQGYQLVHVNGYGVGNAVYYAAIWEKSPGPAYVTRHGMSSSQYQNYFNSYGNAGYRLVQVSSTHAGSNDYYAAIWEKSSGPAYVARHRMSSKNYQSEFDNMYYQNYRLKQVNGCGPNGSARYTAIWEKKTGGLSIADATHIDNIISKFMQNHKVPGLSLAIAKEGRLIFAKGYGFANQSNGEKVSPKHLFRIASVSKPITSVAIMKLVEEGKISLNDKVFGPGSILGNQYGSLAFSPWETNIRVRHLLEHTAGGNTWNNNGNDGSSAIMFDQTSYNHSQLIGWVLDTRNPSHAPGTIYDYSNFGYCVLGRIIEKVTGKSYEAYLRQNVLNLCGISDMHIAKDLKSQKRHNEVVYHHSNPNAPYSMKVNRMDAHGGWIASSIDLVRFAVHVDGFSTEPDILSASTVNTMLMPSAANVDYGKGWAKTKDNDGWWHNGSISGTGAFLYRQNNGITWAILINSNYNNDLDNTMKDVVNGINSWPNINLF